MTQYAKPPPLGSDIAPPEGLYARVRAVVATTPASATSTRKRILAALALALGLTAAIVLIASEIVYERAAAGLDVAVNSTPHLLLVLFLLVGLTVVATRVAVERGSRGLGASVMTLIAMAVLVTPLSAALILVNPVHSDDLGALSVELSPWGARCLAIATVIGVLVLGSLSIALRRSAPVASGLRGAALGAAAGAWAALGVFVFCPASEFQHLLVGHVLPIAIFTLSGFGVASLLRP